MKLNFIKGVAFAAGALFITSGAVAQFTGTIQFNKKVGSTVNVNYKYFVSGDQVRVEEINESNQVEGIQIIDTKEKSSVSLSPERKMYMKTPVRRSTSALNVDVKETKDAKTINGFKCIKYVVTCAEKDRKVEYWIAEGDFDFFIPMLETLNRKENQAMFFLQIPSMEGKFPMLSKEYTLSTGKEISVLSAESVKKESVDAGKFKVPSDYSFFER